MPNLEEKPLPAEDLVAVQQPAGSATAAPAGTDVDHPEQANTEDKHVDDTDPSANLSDAEVEPKQEEQSVAAELGKGKVALIMSALCVSFPRVEERRGRNANVVFQIAVFLAALDTVRRAKGMSLSKR